jgi:hypothetical protein
MTLSTTWSNDHGGPITVPIELYLCEINRLILHPDQLYIFRKHPDCKECAKYESMWWVSSEDAYRR